MFGKGSPPAAMPAAGPSTSAGERGEEGIVPTQAGSIYVELLEATLGEREPSLRSLSASEALAELVRRRRRVVWTGSSPVERDWAAAALADQVAYDSALIRYSRRLGIDCDPRRFGVPGPERQRIEHALESRGIPLGP